MIGGIAAIGAALIGGATSIFAARKAKKENQRMQRYFAQQEADNQAWYNANALSDYTQRGDTQNLMRQLRENLGKQNKIAESSSVVTGATPEQQAVMKEQSNRVIADTFANIGAQGQAWKDRITDRYLARKEGLADQRIGAMGQQKQMYGNLMGQGLGMLQAGISDMDFKFGK